MRRPGETGYQIAVADRPVGGCLDVFPARQSHFRRTGGVGRYPSAADDVGRGDCLLIRNLADASTLLCRFQTSGRWNARAAP
jgi:hypothetical protein